MPGKKIFLISILFPILLFSQEQKKTLLIIPLSKNNIRLSSLAEKNIKYNNMNRDSVVDYIVSTINSETEQVFRNYSLHYLKEFNSAGEFSDSVFHYKLFNCFYYDAKDSSLKNIKYKSTSLGSYHNKYSGCDLNASGLEVLKNAITSSKCDYILFFNKFEIINPNAGFSLHIEIMDNALNRIYGNKNEIKRDISKTMYAGVFKYYIKSSCEDMIVKTEKYLDNKK